MASTCLQIEWEEIMKRSLNSFWKKKDVKQK